MVGKTKPASAGFLLPASCGLFCVWSGEGLKFSQEGRTGGGSSYATMQLRSHDTQICSYATMFQMFWEFSTYLERSNFSLEHPSNNVLSFLSNVPKQESP